MILVILGIGLILTVLGFIIEEKSDDYEFGEALVCSGMIIGIISFIATLVLLIAVTSRSRTIDDRIQLYTEQNNKIEAYVSELVYNYMDYEAFTYKEFKPEESIMLVSLYPELKSDALISKELDLYVNNVNKITELNEKKIELKVLKWWLYFGGGK